MSTIIDLVQLVVELDAEKSRQFERANLLEQELAKERDRTKELQTQLVKHSLLKDEK